jgi:TolB-like protein/Tfp pilus assembly protein PilF
MPEPNAPTAVFISYASEDAGSAARICEALRAAGIDVWLDQDALRGGDAWDAKIRKQIQDCALFIPVISAHTNARAEGYFRGEWNLATRRMLNMAQDAAFLVPVVIDGLREPDARVPEEFLRAHWTRLPQGETPPAFARQVRELLDSRRRAATSTEARPPAVARTLAETLRAFVARPAGLAAIGAVALVAAILVYVGIQRDPEEREAATADLPMAAASELPARSVAVLVFEDRGGSGGSDVLAEGIPETVMHQLSLMKGLTVISRKSSFAFKGSDEDMRVIGRKLNVRYLLEGSVQIAGKRLRVTTSLIDAQTGASVWSDQYNPEQQDVFAVQDQIALEVARALQVTLASANDPQSQMRIGGTENYDAYFEFLRGRALLASVRVGDLPAAVESLEAAIKLDPKFASAYVLLARAKTLLAEQGGDLKNFPKERQAALDLINYALVLNPQSGEAYVERGYLTLIDDAAAADADFRRAIELAPNYPRAYESLAAEYFLSIARRREALDMLEKARRLDPLDMRLDVLKALYLLWGPGDVAQAAQIAESVLQRDPLYVLALVRLAEIRWCGQDRYAEAVALGEQAVALDPGNEMAWRYLSMFYLSLNETAAANDALRHTSEYSGLQVILQVQRGEWRKAGESAYSLIAGGSTSYRQIETEISLAIRKDAEATGDYAHAISALESWALVSWEDGEPVLEGQLDMGVNVAALGDLLMATGKKDEARALLGELLADTDVQIKRYGRGEIWLNGGRARALALLGRPDEAVATLQRQAALGFLNHTWRAGLDAEPAFDTLRTRADFKALVSEARSVEARERAKLQEMRKEGQVPDRS